MSVKVEGILKIIADHRITLPQEVREEWGVQEGNVLHYEMIDGSLVINPIDIKPRKKSKKSFTSSEDAIKHIKDL